MLRPNQVDIVRGKYRVILPHLEDGFGISPTAERRQEGPAAMEREVGPASEATTFLAVHQEIQGLVAWEAPIRSAEGSDRRPHMSLENEGDQSSWLRRRRK